MPIGHDLFLATRILREGGLVAFPTETVYGLGARADSAAAVQRIFEVKGRPASHPLIVHLAAASELHHWAEAVPTQAEALAAAFWPGPLTLVLRRRAHVPLAVTGGLETIGLRVPDHPIALALLRELKLGIAAPSANRFTHVSPTRSEHVERDLGGSVDYILEGGACAVGIESTIVDLSGEAITILRPGGVPKEAIEAALRQRVGMPLSPETRAPGQHPLHYAPRAQVQLVAPEELGPLACALAEQGHRVGILATGISPKNVPRAAVQHTVTGGVSDLARELYHALRELDSAGVDVILTSVPEAGGLGLGVADRLLKAAGPRRPAS